MCQCLAMANGAESINQERAGQIRQDVSHGAWLRLLIVSDHLKQVGEHHSMNTFEADRFEVDEVRFSGGALAMLSMITQSSGAMRSMRGQQALLGINDQREAHEGDVQAAQALIVGVFKQIEGLLAVELAIEDKPVAEMILENHQLGIGQRLALCRLPPVQGKQPATMFRRKVGVDAPQVEDATGNRLGLTIKSGW